MGRMGTRGWGSQVSNHARKWEEDLKPPRRNGMKEIPERDILQLTRGRGWKQGEFRWNQHLKLVQLREWGLQWRNRNKSRTLGYVLESQSPGTKIQAGGWLTTLCSVFISEAPSYLQSTSVPTRGYPCSAVTYLWVANVECSRRLTTVCGINHVQKLGKRKLKRMGSVLKGKKTWASGRRLSQRTGRKEWRNEGEVRQGGRSHRNQGRTHWHSSHSSNCWEPQDKSQDHHPRKGLLKLTRWLDLAASTELWG